MNEFQITNIIETIVLPVLLFALFCTVCVWIFQVRRDGKKYSDRREEAIEKIRNIDICEFFETPLERRVTLTLNNGKEIDIAHNAYTNSGSIIKVGQQRIHKNAIASEFHYSESSIQIEGIGEIILSGNESGELDMAAIYNIKINDIWFRRIRWYFEANELKEIKIFIL